MQNLIEYGNTVSVGDLIVIKACYIGQKRNESMRARERGGQNGGLAQSGTAPGSHKSKKPFGVRDRQPQGRVFFWRRWAINSHCLFSPCTESPVLLAKAACIQREPGQG